MRRSHVNNNIIIDFINISTANIPTSVHDFACTSSAKDPAIYCDIKPNYMLHLYNVTFAFQHLPPCATSSAEHINTADSDFSTYEAISAKCDSNEPNIMLDHSAITYLHDRGKNYNNTSTVSVNDKDTIFCTDAIYISNSAITNDNST